MQTIFNLPDTGVDAPSGKCRFVAVETTAGVIVEQPVSRLAPVRDFDLGVGPGSSGSWGA